MTNKTDASSRDRRLAAALAAVGIIAGFVTYWLVQIQSVRELLEMAYG